VSIGCIEKKGWRLRRGAGHARRAIDRNGRCQISFRHLDKLILVENSTPRIVLRLYSILDKELILLLLWKVKSKKLNRTSTGDGFNSHPRLQNLTNYSYRIPAKIAMAKRQCRATVACL
jgi:hypothetical protein